MEESKWDAGSKNLRGPTSYSTQRREEGGAKEKSFPREGRRLWWIYLEGTFWRESLFFFFLIYIFPSLSTTTISSSGRQEGGKSCQTSFYYVQRFLSLSLSGEDIYFLKKKKTIPHVCNQQMDMFFFLQDSTKIYIYCIFWIYKKNGARLNVDGGSVTLKEKKVGANFYFSAK